MKYFKTLSATILVLAFIFMTNQLVFSQTIKSSKLSEAETSKQLKESNEVTALTKLMAVEGFKEGDPTQKGISKPASQVFKWKEGNDNYELRMVSKPLYSAGKGSSNLIYSKAFKNGKVIETSVFAEAGEITYSAEGNNLKSSKGRWDRILDCFKQFVSGGGTGQCLNCFNSLKSCWGKPFFKFIGCIYDNAGSSSCNNCIGSVWSLVKCIKKAW